MIYEHTLLLFGCVWACVWVLGRVCVGVCVCLKYIEARIELTCVCVRRDDGCLQLEAQNETHTHSSLTPLAAAHTRAYI